MPSRPCCRSRPGCHPCSGLGGNCYTIRPLQEVWPLQGVWPLQEVCHVAEVLCPWRPRCVVAASGGVALSGGVSRGRGVAPVASEVCRGRFRRCGPFRRCVAWPRCCARGVRGVSWPLQEVWPVQGVCRDRCVAEVCRGRFRRCGPFRRCDRCVAEVWPRCDRCVAEVCRPRRVVCPRSVMTIVWPPQEACRG